MTLETTSKNMDGITDLVVVAPIKDGFIAAYENVTFATRLKIVAEALNRVPTHDRRNSNENRAGSRGEFPRNGSSVSRSAPLTLKARPNGR